MSPCIRSHCPSSEKYCQRSSCTLELRNRLEHRRVQRDQLHAKLKAEILSSMRALLELLDKCDSKLEQSSIWRVKDDLEKQSAKPLGRLKCYCAQCAVVYKDREISALRKDFQAQQVVRRFVEDKQRACRSKSKPKSKVASMSSRSASSIASSAQKRQVSRAATPVKTDGGFGMVTAMRGLTVKDLLDRGAVLEREKLVIYGRHRR